MAATISRSIQLPNDGRVAVIGGGPAGSFFALFALHFASQWGRRLTVTIFEPRDFTRTGPWGCNMCAGLIPVRVLTELAETGIHVPPYVIRERISHYTLHTAAGQIRLPQPDPEGDVVSVYRGGGPRHGPIWPDPISFDGFLLNAAQSQGAELIPQRVTSVSLTPTPVVETAVQRFPADLVVLATGVNSRTLHFTDLHYHPPPRQQMAQTEICLGAEKVKQALGGSVHIFLPRDSNLRFGSLVPKGPCINVSLLGETLPQGTLARFLALPEVRKLLPDPETRACGCRPRIAVGPARPLFADHFVAVGDAGITRLYKNGIGTALRTARQAACTALFDGIDAAAFATHYGPVCREIALDNLAGRFLFAFTHIFQHYAWLTRPHLCSIAAEQAWPPEKRIHSRLLWGMFTGTYSYRKLLFMACRPDLQARLLYHLVEEITEKARSFPTGSATLSSPPDTESVSRLPRQ